MATKILYIMRGISGSGKSTHAKSIDPTGKFICSADNYFIDPKTNRYKFIGIELDKAHAKCFDKFTKLIKKKSASIVLDNTNIKIKDFKDYVDLAKRNGYSITVVAFLPVGDDGKVNLKYVRQCADRNKHGVDYEVCLNQARCFEVDPVD